MLSDLSQSSPAIQGQLDSMIGQTIEHSTSTSLNTLASWLQEHRDHPLYDRTVQQFAQRTRADDPEAALRWADTINLKTEIGTADCADCADNEVIAAWKQLTLWMSQPPTLSP